MTKNLTDQEIREHILAHTKISSECGGMDFIQYQEEDGGEGMLELQHFLKHPRGKILGGFHVCPEDCENLPDGHPYRHPYKGMKAGAVMPNSIWTPHHHPKAWRDGGYTFNPESGEYIMLYPATLENGKLVSRYGAKVANNISYGEIQDKNMFGDDVDFIDDRTFTLAAAGSNDRTSKHDNWDDFDFIVHGFKDTKGRTMISNCGAFGMCGFIWQYLDTGDAPCAVLLGGGDWNNAASCGPRCRFASTFRSYALTDRGARGRSRVSEDPSDIM